MTNDRSDKVRALILSALMMLSIMVGGVAFSGSAAANTAPSDISGTVSPTDVPTQSVTHEVTVNIDKVAADDADDTITVASDLGTSLSISNVQAENESGDSLTNTPTVSGADITVDPVAAEADSTSPDEANLTVTFDLGIDYSGETSLPNTGDVTVDVDDSVGGPTGATSIDTVTVSDVTRDVDTAAAGGDIYAGAVVFQGEEDITFNGDLTETLTGVSGDAEGQVLNTPIASDQTLGVYATDGDTGPSVTVNRPRVTSFDINNQNGEDISGGSIGKADADLDVVAEYNFDEAEDLEISVDEESGLDITDDVVSGTQVQSGPDVTYNVDLTNEDAGTYTITVEGTDDLDFGQAVETGTVELTAEDNIGIEAGSDTVTQGDNVQYDVTGSVAGNFHLVQISSNDFRDGQSGTDYGTIFRNVEDVEERGIIFQSNLHEAGNGEILADAGLDTDNDGDVEDDITAAYAVVSIDDDTGLGVGSIDTTDLDTVSVTTDVSDPLSATAIGNLGTGTAEPVPTFTGQDSDSTDDVEFDVEEGEVTLDSPGNTYVSGAEIDVNGTAPSGMDSVAIFARDEGDFERVEIDGADNISVDADGTFDEEDVRLSDDGNADGNDILSLPGSYRIGVIDSDDVDGDTLTTQEFNQGTSSQSSIRVIGTSLDAEFPSLVDGQISEDDGDVTVNGSAPGSQDVLFIAVGPRGNTFTQQIGVDSDQTFDEEDIALGGISKGAISLHVYSLGRDDRVGDGDLPGQTEDLNGFDTFVDTELQSQGLTGDQVRSSILAQTVEADATDDQLVNQNARLVDTQSRIVNVYQEGNQASGINPVAAGETLVLEGQTNLQPDDNTITAEVSTEDVSVGLAATDEWGQDGQFSVEIDTTDAATGTYTLEIDDGQNSVTEDVELVEEVSTATPTPTEADDTATATASPTPTATASPTATAAPDTDTPTPTEGGGPGFGAIVALVALLAAALLATRRNN